MEDDIRHRIERNLALVEHVVTRMAARFPNHVDRDDLVQAGRVALIETAGRYDPDRGVAFSTFAARRIEGAILDVVRGSDWLPRSLRAKARELDALERQLQLDRSAIPTEREVAVASGLTEAELSQLRAKIHRGAVLALDQPLGTDSGTATLGDMVSSDSGDPLQGLEGHELHSYVQSALHLLPERHRIVVIGYFLEGRSMDELGQLLGVTQSRISQIKDDALRRIREGVAAQYDDTPVARSTGRGDRRRAEYARSIAANSTPRARLVGAGAR